MDPLQLIPILVVFLVIVWRRPVETTRRALQVPIFVLAVLWALATPLVGNSLIGILEKPFVTDADCGNAEAIVVLSGGLSGDPQSDTAILLLHDASLRRSIAGAIWLGRHPGVPAYVVGGYGRHVTEAEAMRQLMTALGTANRINVVDDPKSTRESATAVADIPELDGKTVGIVTSAYHMSRTRLEFESAGISICPIATDFRLARIGGLGSVIPNTGALTKSALSIHEFLGIAYATVRG